MYSTTLYYHDFNEMFSLFHSPCNLSIILPPMLERANEILKNKKNRYRNCLGNVVEGSHFHHCDRGLIFITYKKNLFSLFLSGKGFNNLIPISKKEREKKPCHAINEVCSLMTWLGQVR